MKHIQLFVVIVGLFIGCNCPVYAENDLTKQVEELAMQLTATAKGEVLKGAGTKVYISLGQQQGILQGNRFEIIRQGEPLLIDGKAVGHEETFVAEAVVERARDTFSICNVSKAQGVPGKGDKVYQIREKINSVVIGQFTHNQGFNALTKSLQEKLLVALTMRGIRVVERDQLEKVLKEQKLGYSGLINMSSAQKIGQLLGADGMLLGTISDLGNTVTINARLVQVGSGNAISAGEVELYKTPMIAQLMETAVYENAPEKSAVEGRLNKPSGGPQALSEKEVQRNKGGSTSFKMDLTQYEIGDLLKSFSKNLIVVERNGEKFIQSLDNNGKLTINNLQLTNNFELNFTADWNDFTQMVTLHSASNKEISLQFDSHMIQFGSTKKRHGDTSWKGGSEVNRCSLKIKANVAKCFINDKFFATMIIPPDLTFTKLTITGIKQDDFLNNVELQSL